MGCFLLILLALFAKPGGGAPAPPPRAGKVAAPKRVNHLRPVDMAGFYTAYSDSGPWVTQLGPRGHYTAASAEGTIFFVGQWHWEEGKHSLHFHEASFSVWGVGSSISYVAIFAPDEEGRLDVRDLKGVLYQDGEKKCPFRLVRGAKP